MTKSRIFVLSAAGVIGVVTAISFLVLKGAENRLTKVGELDKAELVYQRAETLIESHETDKATSALVLLITNYPDSSYAEKSLEKLASVYHEKGDMEKTSYYYGRLLKSFPDTPRAKEIRDLLEKTNMELMQSSHVTQDSIEHVVQSGDTLSGIAKKFKTTVELIKKTNNITSDLIMVGQKLKIIVSRFSIFVDKSKNILVLKKDGELFKTYSVSTGKDNSTPVGVFKIEEKLVRPLWYKVGAVVSPDSSEYELGERWMGLSIEGYGIHGTSDESSIGKQVTRGCVRMRNSDIIELYSIVPSGTEVEIIDGQSQ